MKFPEHKTIDILGVGNALVDILVPVEDTFLDSLGLAKGSMTLVDTEASERYLTAIKDKSVTIAAGGAAANTVKGVGFLGGAASFIGAVGNDEYGKQFARALETMKTSPALARSDELTGNAITYITPDGERTFTVHLGAAATLSATDIDESLIKNAKIVHLEAFQFEGGTKEALERVIMLAKQHDTLVSLDLNDQYLIERNHDLFKSVVKNDVDILFVNETESHAYTGTNDEYEAAMILKEEVSIVVVKVGEKGSLISDQSGVVEVPSVKTEVVDTTGAGDMYAAGFLYGLTKDGDYTESAKAGAALASKVIAQIGTELR